MCNVIKLSVVVEMAIIPVMATISHSIKHFVLFRNLGLVLYIIQATGPSSHDLVRFTDNHNPVLDFIRVTM